MIAEKKRTQWIYPRHRIVTFILYCVLSPFSRWRYGIRITPFRENADRQFLILMNHQTAFDQFFIGIAFRKPIYYLASEDLFSNGWISSLIRFLVAPIPIKKQTTDITAVMNCIRVAREGGSIAIAPEGNRTYSGKTEYFNPAIASLAQKLGLPIALFRIEGGYGVHPRWSDVVRRGKMRAYVSRVIEPEEYKNLSPDALNQIIAEELSVNEGCTDSLFFSKKSAEYLERVVYVCPHCGLASWESRNDRIHCTKCGCHVRYLPTKELEGIDQPFPFRFVTEWYDYQCDYVNHLDTREYLQTPLFRDTARLSQVIVYKKKLPLRKQAEIALYGDRIVIDEGSIRELTLPFSELSAVTVLGRNKLNIYHGKTLYQLKGSKRFNALKYVNLFYRHKNITRGDMHGKFLGL